MSNWLTTFKHYCVFLCYKYYGSQKIANFTIVFIFIPTINIIEIIHPKYGMHPLPDGSES